MSCRPLASISQQNYLVYCSMTSFSAALLLTLLPGGFLTSPSDGKPAPESDQPGLAHRRALCFAEENEEKQPLTSKEEKERQIAEMGRPVLGEHTKLEVIIEESYEFKVLSTSPVPVLLLLQLGTLLLGLHSIGKHMLMVSQQSEAALGITRSQSRTKGHLEGWLSQGMIKG